MLDRSVVLYGVIVVACLSAWVWFMFVWNDWIGSLAGAGSLATIVIPWVDYRESRIKKIVMDEAREALKSHRYATSHYIKREKGKLTDWIEQERAADAGPMRDLLIRYNQMAEQNDKLTPLRDKAGKYMSPKVRLIEQDPDADSSEDIRH